MNYQPQTYEMIFIFAGMIWIGLTILVLAVIHGIRKLRTPKPEPPSKLPLVMTKPARSRWQQDWEDIEKRLNR